MLGNEKGFKDRNIGAQTVFEKERDQLLSEAPNKRHCMDDVKKMLYTSYADPDIPECKNLLSFPE